MPMEGDPAEREEDEQVGMAWTNWSEHVSVREELHDADSCCKARLPAWQHGSGLFLRLRKDAIANRIILQVWH